MDFCSAVGNRLVAQDEVGHLAAQLVGLGDGGEALRRLRRSFSSSSTFWKTGKPLSAREMRKLSVKPSRLRQQAKEISSRAMYSATILRDDAVPVERRAVVAHEDLEARQRRGDGLEIAGGALRARRSFRSIRSEAAPPQLCT